jgi:DtxR family transcriptional regulator, Mn-dependent transcriptional regulator
MTVEQSASMEDYLKAVEMLRSKGGAVRIKEISALLGVKMPSVTAAMKRLSEDRLVVHERYGRVKLTPAGKKLARDVFRRHDVLRRFLIGILDMDPQTAAEDACRIEHVISTIAFERLDKFLSFVESFPQDKIPWLSNYQRYLERSEMPNCSKGL